MNMLSGMDVLATESVTGLRLRFIYDSFQRATYHALEQHHLTELSEIMGILARSHMWLSSSRNAASATEELIYFILF